MSIPDNDLLTVRTLAEAAIEEAASGACVSVNRVMRWADDKGAWGYVVLIEPMFHALEDFVAKRLAEAGIEHVEVRAGW